MELRLFTLLSLEKDLDTFQDSDPEEMTSCCLSHHPGMKLMFLRKCRGQFSNQSHVVAVVVFCYIAEDEV